jgi:hypothetical protein
MRKRILQYLLNREIRKTQSIIDNTVGIITCEEQDMLRSPFRSDLAVLKKALEIIKH